ncbi:MAG: hypothetical protein M1383_03600 [Patescibacteria group bacterium]|nr:hypothetical protein [Patescibacteria group bacterium]
MSDHGGGRAETSRHHGGGHAEGAKLLEGFADLAMKTGAGMAVESTGIFEDILATGKKAGAKKTHAH